MVLKITALALIVSGLCLADPIIFTIQGDAAGTVGATAFGDVNTGLFVPFALTVTTDTSLITPFTLGDGETGFITPEIAGVGISISGIGSGTFTDTEDIFVSNTTSYVGITDSVYEDLLDGFNTSLSTYDLQSAIGPLPLTALLGIGQFGDVPTSLGSVTFLAASNVFFTASTTFTPEPGTLLLTAGALLLAGVKLLARAR